MDKDAVPGQCDCCQCFQPQARASNTHENSFKSSLSASINLHVKPASFHFPGNLLGSILPVTSISEITNDVNASSELGLAGGIKTLSNVSKSQKYIEIP